MAAAEQYTLRALGVLDRCLAADASSISESEDASGSRLVTGNGQCAEHHRPVLGVLLNNIAVFYHRHGRFAEAVQQMQRAVDLRTESIGIHHQDTRNSIDRLHSLKAALREQSNNSQ